MPFMVGNKREGPPGVVCLVVLPPPPVFSTDRSTEGSGVEGGTVKMGAEKNQVY